MPSKTYKLPEKIANLPAEELVNVVQHPEDYGMTIIEYTEFLKYVTTIGMSANVNVNNGEINSLKLENAQLKEENDKLQRRINTMRELFDDVRFSVDTYQEIFVMD